MYPLVPSLTIFPEREPVSHSSFQNESCPPRRHCWCSGFFLQFRPGLITSYQCHALEQELGIKSATDSSLHWFSCSFRIRVMGTQSIMLRHWKYSLRKVTFFSLASRMFIQEGEFWKWIFKGKVFCVFLWSCEIYGVCVPQPLPIAWTACHWPPWALLQWHSFLCCCIRHTCDYQGYDWQVPPWVNQATLRILDCCNL